MTLSIEQYRKMKSEGKFFWDTDSIKQTQNDISAYLQNVDRQANSSSELWDDDEFSAQRSQLSELRGRLNTLRAYANSLKDDDENAYKSVMDAHSALNDGLNSAERWFSANTDEIREQRRQFIKAQNTEKAFGAMQKGTATAGEQAEKYGLDPKEVRDAYDQRSKALRAELQQDKYGSLSYDELYSLITDPKSYAEKISDEVSNWYRGIRGFDMADDPLYFNDPNLQKAYAENVADGKSDWSTGVKSLDMATGRAKEAAFSDIAKRYGITPEQVQEFYEGSKEAHTAAGYASAALSDKDSDYIIQRLLKTGTSEQLEQLKNSFKNNGTNKIFKKINKGLNQAIEEKKEQEYYTSVLERFPNAEEVINNQYGWESMNKKTPDSVTYRGDMKPEVNSNEEYEANRKEFQKLVDAGVDTARFYKFEKRYKEHKEAEDRNEGFARAADENPVGASLLSIPINMIGSIGDVISYAEAKGDDGYIDTAGTANRAAQTIRDTVNKKIDNPVGQFFYSTGMSIGDMALAAAVDRIAPGTMGAVMSGSMFFSSAGVSAANEVVDSGGTIDQAAMTLLTHGAAELIFEEFSLDKLKALKVSGEAGKKGLREIAKNAAKQAGIEGSEEFFTTIANTITDGIINGDLSEFNRTKQAYLDQGLSEEEANGRAVADFFKGLGTDFLGGAVSGGVLGGGVSSYNAVLNKSIMNNAPVEIGGVTLTAKQANKLAPEYYHELAQELSKSEDFDVNKLIEQAKEGGEKSQQLAAAMERTVKEKGEGAIKSADVENVLISLYGDSVEASQTGENLERAEIIKNIEKDANESRAESFINERLSEYDETGAKKAEGSRDSGKTTKAFGLSHPQGVYATDAKNNKVVITAVDSSVKEYGADDRSVILRTEDGQRVNASEVSFDNLDFQRLVNLAPNYDTLGARALLANYEGAKARGLSVDAYIQQSEALYKIGRSGVTFDSAVKSPEFKGIIDSMGKKAAKSFLDAGNADTEMRIELDDINLKRVRVPGTRTSAGSRLWAKGGAKIKGSAEFTQIMQAIAEVVSKDGKLGTDIVFTDDLKSEDRGVYANNRIYISADADEHIMVITALHEAVHKAKVYAPKEYRALEKFVMNYLVSTGQDTKGMLDNIEAIWGEDAKDIETQREELIAQTVAALASDEKAFLKAVEIKENKSLLEKVREALKNIIERVRRFFRDVETKVGHNIQAQPWVNDLEALDKLAEKFNELMAASRENEAVYGERESGTIKFSRMNRDSFENNVKKVLSISDDFAIKNMQEGNFVSIMEETPDVILEHVENAKDLETIISFHSLYLAARKNGVLEGHYHNLGKKIIELPKYMCNPDTILLMDNGRLNLVSTISDQKNKGVISIELNTVKDINNKYNAYNLVISVFTGKNNYIRNNIKKHAVAVKYEKDDLSQVNPQLYEWLAIINDKSSFKNNIPQSSENSNTNSEIQGKKSKNDAFYFGDVGKTYSQNFKEWFGDWQNDPQNASKVVDKDGKPLVVYHQTASDFTVFNTDNPLAGLNDSETPNGIFFKTNDHDIGLQGKKQMPVYLNIRKMLSFTGRPEANRWYRNHVKGYEALDETMKHEIGKIEKKMNDIEDEMFQDISTEEYDKLDQEWNSLLEEMRTVEDEYRGKLRNLLNDYFLNGNSGYDGIHLAYDGHRYVNGNREDVETYIVFKNTQVKSAKDNIGTFDKSNPDIRYSKNDTFYFDDDGDLFFGEDDEVFDKAFPNDEYGRTFGEIVDDEGGQIDVDRLLTEHPEDAAYRLYQALAKTTGNGLRNYNGVRLDREDYIKAARRVMKRYGILQRNNHGFDSELAERMSAFADEVKNNPRAGFSLFVNALALDCKKYLEERSGDYEREFLGDIAKQVYSTLRGSTLIITPYAESHVLENYGGIKGVRKAFKGYANVGFEKDIGRYKRPVYMDGIIEEIALATGEHLGNGEHSILFPNGERPDSLSGWSWLENLLTNVLKPKFVSPYKEGMVESVESAALEMAFDISAEILTEKTSKAAATRNIDRKTIKELSDTQKKALAERDALHKVKAEKYLEQIDRLKKRVQRERGLKELAQEDLDVLKRFVRSDTKNFRQQYQSSVRAQNDLEAVRRSMNKIRTMIVNPTNEKYIPPEILHNTVFLDAFEALGESIAMNSRSQAAKKMDTMLLQIKALKTESEKKFDGDFETAFDKEFTAQLQNVVDWLKAETLEDMEGVRKKISRDTFSNDEIAEMRALIDEVVFRIDNARKFLGRRDAALAQEASEAVIAQTREINGNKAQKVFAGYAEQMMNPLRVANLMSNYNEDSWLRKLFNDINEGQRKQWFWEMQAEKMFSELTEKYEDDYKSACNDVLHFDYMVDGKDYHVDMTRMQGLQVLMTWKRESGSRMAHMKRGGIVVADPKKVAKGKGRAWENSQSVPVGSDLINQIIKTMGKFENEYMQLAENYFNKMAKDAINETFMKTRHREIARSEYYIPVRVDDKLSQAEIKSLKYDLTIEGAGSYKHITPHAPQPILIESLNSVIARHIRQTGKLYGLDIPLINFKRMFKGTTRASVNQSQMLEWDSVKKALSEKFGERSVKYIEDTIAAIEGGRERKESPVTDFLYKVRVNTALIGNLGVVIKQAASFPTAGRYLSAKDLSAGAVLFTKKGIKNYKGIIDEIDRHTAQHYQRRKGMSVQEVADMMNKSKFARKAPTVINPVKWIQGMDCLTTAALWEAVKHNVDGQYKKSGKKTDSEAYWKDVTALYDMVIEDTQPMYDELHRSEFQKGGSNFRKFVFPFKTQPMQNMGILADAAAEFVAKKDKVSAVKFAKAVSSQASSLLVFSLMTFAAAVIRHRADRYKDEDDNITFMSVVPNVLWDMMSNGITTIAPIGGEFIIPAAEDIVESVKDGKIKKENIQSATELSLVNGWFSKAANAGNKLIEQLNGTNKAGVDPWDMIWKVLDIPGTFSELLGVPYSNISLLFKSAGNYAKDIFKNEGLTNNYGEFKTENAARHILNAYNSGNNEKAGKLTELWIEQKMSEGKTRDKATDYVEKRLIAGVSGTEQAKRAAIAEYSGNYNEAERLKKELTDKGISKNVVEKAVEQYAKNIMAQLKDGGVESAEEAAERFKAEGFSGSGAADAAKAYIKSLSESDGDDEDKARFTTSDAFNALKNGEGESYDTIREYLIQRKVAEGKSEEEAAKSVDSSVRSLSRTKPLFDDYHSVSGEKFYTAKKQLENIYGAELEKKYKEYVKKYINK